MGFSLASFILGVVAWGLILSAVIWIQARIYRRKRPNPLTDPGVKFDDFFLVSHDVDRIGRALNSLISEFNSDTKKLAALMKYLGVEDHTEAQRTYIRKTRKGKR